MALFGIDALKRRVYGGGNTDSRSTQGIFSRGANVYNGGSSSAGGGRPPSSTTQSTSRFSNHGGQDNRSQQPAGGQFNPQPAGGYNWGGNLGGNRYNTGQRPTQEYNPPAQNQGGGMSQPANPWQQTYNHTYAEALRGLMGNASTLQSTADHMSQRTNEDFSTATERLGEWRDDTLDNWKYRTADQGLVHSGINIDQQAEIGNQYLQQQQDYETNLARSQEDIQRQLASSLEELNERQRQMEMGNAQYQAGLADQQAQAEAAARAEEERQAALQPSPTGRIPVANPVQQEGPSMASIANRLGYGVGNQMDDADYLKMKDHLGIKVGKTLDPEDKAAIDAALKRRAAQK